VRGLAQSLFLIHLRLSSKEYQKIILN